MLTLQQERVTVKAWILKVKPWVLKVKPWVLKVKPWGKLMLVISRFGALNDALIPQKALYLCI